MNRRQCLSFFAAVSVAPSLPAEELVADDSVRAFIRHMRSNHQFAEADLANFFSRLSINNKVLKLNGVPSNNKTRKKTYWREYRKSRLTAKNITAGKQFLRQNADDLQRAERTYGIPVAVIVAIIGIETRYGEYFGNIPVAEALTTLAFAHPQRGREFRDELEHFLLYTRDRQIDPFSISGSYAGAFGMPQFLPSSVRRFAVDFDNNGNINLFNATDAIGSIGNFLKQHGWQVGTALTYAARIVGDAEAVVAIGADNDYKAVFTRKQLIDMGVLFEAPASDELYLVVDLENLYDTEYRVGTRNFYALTRYNRSFKYAATVTDLATAIADGA